LNYQTEAITQVMISKLILNLVLVLFISSPEYSDDYYAELYLNSYKDIAVAEMHRTGIPASIKLAQGMHESAYGKSKLATNARNHFGIKCKSYWTGQTYYHKDDDYKQGKLIDSCFRSYGSDLDSYVDHSNFLVNTKHYSNLFEISRYDYQGWARGLKASGYATDARYAEKIIRKIEKYNLDVFDHSPSPFTK